MVVEESTKILMRDYIQSQAQKSWRHCTAVPIQTQCAFASPFSHSFFAEGIRNYSP
jgi:hypothetical protein